jgi:hypothetical protein
MQRRRRTNLSAAWRLGVSSSASFAQEPCSGAPAVPRDDARTDDRGHSGRATEPADDRLAVHESSSVIIGERLVPALP